MKASVKATAMYREAIGTVAVLTKYMAFLNTEPDREAMKENIGQLEDLEAQLQSLLTVVTNAKITLDAMFKAEISPRSTDEQV